MNIWYTRRRISRIRRNWCSRASETIFILKYKEYLCVVYEKFCKP